MSTTAAPRTIEILAHGVTFHEELNLKLQHIELTVDGEDVSVMVEQTGNLVAFCRLTSPGSHTSGTRVLAESIAGALKNHVEADVRRRKLAGAIVLDHVDPSFRRR